MTNPAQGVLSVLSVLPVERIEPSLPFFHAVGFKETVSVPEGDHLGFIILMKDDVQVSLQTIQSILDDDASFAEVTKHPTSFLYFTVSDIDALAEMLSDFDITMSKRTTFYGAQEIGYKEPGGHIVTFAEFPAAES